MKPVIVELTDFKTKEVVDHLEVDAVLVATGRAPYTAVLPLSGPALHMCQSRHDRQPGSCTFPRRPMALRSLALLRLKGT